MPSHAQIYQVLPEVFLDDMRCTGRLRLFKVKVELDPWPLTRYLIRGGPSIWPPVTLFCRNLLISFHKYCPWNYIHRGSKVTQPEFLE